MEQGKWLDQMQIDLLTNISFEYHTCRHGFYVNNGKKVLKQNPNELNVIAGSVIQNA